MIQVQVVVMATIGLAAVANQRKSNFNSNSIITTRALVEQQQQQLVRAPSTNCAQSKQIIDRLIILRG